MRPDALRGIIVADGLLDCGDAVAGVFLVHDASEEADAWLADAGAGGSMNHAASVAAVLAAERAAVESRVGFH